jgi:hypothetical protein
MIREVRGVYLYDWWAGLTMLHITQTCMYINGSLSEIVSLSVLQTQEK